MAEEWIDTVDENGDDIRVLSPADVLSGRSVVPASNGIGVIEMQDDLIGMFMDESDWNFVIDCLRFRARNTSYKDTRERANFTADTMQDVLDGAR